MPGSRTAAGADPVGEAPAPHGPTTSFRPVVHLTKGEAFDACQALADADRVLVAAGTTAEARALGDLFELLEDRLTRHSWPGRTTRQVPIDYEPCSGS